MIKKGLKWLGLDRPVLYSLTLRIWNGLSQPVTLILLAAHLTSAEQGFYYSFSGIQALSVIAELGITFVIGQFAAHEHASMILAGDANSAAYLQGKERLASIFRLGVFWNVIVALVCIVIFVPGGLWFFSDNTTSTNIDWKMPWILFVVFSSLNVILSPVYAILNGIGYIGDTIMIQLLQTVVSTLALWLVLATNHRLYAVVISPAAGFVGGGAGVIVWHGKTLVGIWKKKTRDICVRYWKEIFPLQSKVALSWLSGYVGFYFSTPVIFKTLSPEIAGQYGMTANILLAISTSAAVWVNVRSPVFAHLAAGQKRSELRHVFMDAAAKSTIIAAIGYGLLCLGQQVPYISTRFAFMHRLVEPKILLVFIAAYCLAHVYGLLNVYFRSFKVDPLFWVSMSAAFTTLMCLSRITRGYGLMGTACLGLVLNGVSLLIAVAYMRREFRVMASNPKAV